MMYKPCVLHRNWYWRGKINISVNFRNVIGESIWKRFVICMELRVSLRTMTAD